MAAITMRQVRGAGGETAAEALRLLLERVEQIDNEVRGARKHRRHGIGKVKESR